MRLFEYTPHIYTKENNGWKTHKQIFIALQLLPLITSGAFQYFEEGTDVALIVGFLTPLLNIYYWIIWTAANVGVLLLAVYDNRKKMSVSA